MFLDGFRQDLRKSRKNVLKVGKSRNFWSKVGHFPKSRKNDSKVGKSRKSRTPLTACYYIFHCANIISLQILSGRPMPLEHFKWNTPFDKQAKVIFIYLDFFSFEKSVSYQKKGGRSHVRPSFFWYDDSGH